MRHGSGRDTTDGELAVTFRDDLEAPGGHARSSTAVINDPEDPTLYVTVTEDGISVGGPWLQPFEVSRGNPIREAECDAVSAVIDQSLTTRQWSDLIESELDRSSSVAEFREAYAKHLQVESSYLDTVLAFQPVYFSRFTELEEVLQERVELTALASEATSSGRLNGYIDSINATVDDLNRIEDNVANTWGALCR